jgi:hypothetical protein
VAKSFDYEKRAQECALRAATAANDQAREVWRQLEAYWLKRASDRSAAIPRDKGPGKRPRPASSQD